MNAKITDKQAKAWSKSGPLHWAAESWKIARENVYADVPADAPQLLSEDYIAKAAEPTDHEQFGISCHLRPFEAASRAA